jgi:hypothetical protein
MSIRPLPAFWINDRFLDHFEYAIDGTACQSAETKLQGKVIYWLCRQLGSPQLSASSFRQA